MCAKINSFSLAHIAHVSKRYPLQSNLVPRSVNGTPASHHAPRVVLALFFCRIVIVNDV